MTTLVRAPEAARRLGVSTATLYSYVSRRRITRTTAGDGKTSLFDVDEINRLLAMNRRPKPPPPTIDVRISTAVTQLGDDGLRYRDIDVGTLVDEPYERVAELLWTGSLPSTEPHWRSLGSPTTPATSDEIADRSVMGLIRLATEIEASTDAPEFARSLLATLPTSFGGPAGNRRPFADRLSRVWVRRPAPELVRAVNTMLVLLADHELATSTLAVRVAASVRASPAAAIIAGLATIEGDLHGSASSYCHRLFEHVERSDATTVLADRRTRRERVPGFGHKIYRGPDPRFDLLLDRVRELPGHRDRQRVVDSVLATSGAFVTQHPNVDLALGALTYVAGLPADIPLFAIGRIAGWTAHYLEELEERPVRYRGLAT